jgi:hypothetical protein
MHGDTTKAVAITVTGFPIRCVPCATTDEAESAFALVAHGFPLLRSLHWFHSRHRIASHLHRSLSHAIYHHHFAIRFFQVKSSPTCICIFTFNPSTHNVFYHYPFYPTLDFVFVPFPCSPPPTPVIPTISITVRAHDLYDSQHYSF